VTDGRTDGWNFCGACPALRSTREWKRCHSNHGYNFVNSSWICTILSLLQKALNFQQNQYWVTHHTSSVLLHYVEKIKNQKFCFLMHVKHVSCDFLSFIQLMSAKCHEN